MFERDHSVPQLSLFAVERRARIEPRLVIEACMRGTVRTFAEWFRVLFLPINGLLRGLAAERHVRSAIRELYLFDDRTLADIGVTRGEVESVVRHGLLARAPRKPGQLDWSSVRTAPDGLERQQAAACDEPGSLRQLGHSVHLKPLIAAIAFATLIVPTFTQVAIAGSPIEVMVASAQTIEPTGSLETVTASAPADPANRASRDRDAADTRDLQAKQALPRDSTFSAVVAKPRWSSLGKSRVKREDQRPRFNRAAAAVSYYSIQSVGLILGVGF